MSFVTFQPLLPASLWLLLAVTAAVLLAWYGLKRPTRIARRSWMAMLALMTAAIATVLVVLLNPTWIEPIQPPAGKPLLTVLVDDSASMAVKDAADATSRYQAAVKLGRSLAEASQSRFDVRVRSFSEAVAPTDLADNASTQPRGMLTDLATAISVSIEANRPAGQAVVLLSDGIHNAGPGSREVLAAVRSARAAGAPIYTCTLGRADAPDIYDLQAEIRLPQQLAYVGQKVPVTVRIRQQAGPAGTVRVTLLNEGGIVDQQDVQIPADGHAEARFMVSRDAPGIYRYEARVEPRPGELITANNTALQFLQVVNEPIRVLLLEGKPYWDSKFLMRTLVADPVIALDSIVRMTESRYLRRMLGTQIPPSTQPADSAPADSTPTDDTLATDNSRQERWTVITNPADLLARPDALKDYQIVVLGRDTEVFLSEAAVNNLRQWMSRQGGSLVCYRGSPALQPGERLAQVLPVQWTEASESRFRMALTEQGQSLQWLGDLDTAADGDVLSRMPSLATVSHVEKPRPLATVLATALSAGSGERWPVISCQNYGTGRVVVIEGAGMWRWAFLSPQHAQQGGVYGSLWQSLMRWLVSGAVLRPGQKMDLRCQRVIVDANEPASATLLLGPEVAAAGTPTVELRIAGEENAIGEFTPVAAGEDPGVFRVGFGKLPPGQYEARVITKGELGPSTRFDVRAPVREQLELAARPDLMARIADESGGAVLKTASSREVAGLFDAYQHRTQPERIRRIPAWDRWYVLLAALGIWTAAWAVRRSGGLI